MPLAWPPRRPGLLGTGLYSLGLMAPQDSETSPPLLPPDHCVPAGTWLGPWERSIRPTVHGCLWAASALQTGREELRAHLRPQDAEGQTFLPFLLASPSESLTLRVLFSERNQKSVLWIPEEGLVLSEPGSCASREHDPIGQSQERIDWGAHAMVPRERQKAVRLSTLHTSDKPSGVITPPQAR